MELLQEHSLLGAYPLRHYRFENGLQALLLHNPISPVMAYLTLYSVGSASEGHQQRGLAHFFEHMMFRETERLGDGDFDRIISEIGGVGLNAFTSYDTTAYHVNVPCRHLRRVIELEADRMANLKLSPELIERERGAVLGEMKMYKDMPSEQLWETVMATAYRSHPYRHPIVGYMEQVEGFRDEDFATFYAQHYAPNRALVVIAGGFDEADTLEMLEQGYGDLSPGAPLAAPAPAEAAPPQSLRKEITNSKISTEYLVMTAHTPGLRHADAPALILLGALLSAGHSSPLHQKLVLGGLATQVSTTMLEPELLLVSPGLFVMDVALQHGVPAEKAEGAIKDVLQNFAEKGIPEDELKRARNQVRLAHFSGMRSNMSLARQVGGYTFACGDPLFGEKLMGEIERVHAGTLRELLIKYWIDAPRATVVQRPEHEPRPS
ncbi:MAG: pitrilysin family protein [SAR324 cluster bacterium]|nr:pitrilysin family protein [SAR324 cluster bacterium]